MLRTRLAARNSTLTSAHQRGGLPFAAKLDDTIQAPANIKAQGANDNGQASKPAKASTKAGLQVLLPSASTKTAARLPARSASRNATLMLVQQRGGLPYPVNRSADTKAHAADDMWQAPMFAKVGTKLGLQVDEKNPKGTLRRLAVQQDCGGHHRLDSQEHVQQLAALNCQFVGSLGIYGPITDLRALASLRGVQGNLHIAASSLATLEGLEGISFVSSRLTIMGPSSLTSLKGLHGLTSAGFIYTQNCHSLASLDGLQKISKTGLQLVGISVTSLQGLEGLEEAGSVTIQYCLSLTSLQGLGRVTAAKSIAINDNSALASLHGLEALLLVEGSVSISNNPSLASLRGLQRLAVVQGSLVIGNCYKVTSLKGLEHLDSIGGPFTLAALPLVSSLKGLDRLTSTGGLIMLGLISVLSLRGIEALRVVSGPIIIQDLPRLRTL